MTETENKKLDEMHEDIRSIKQCLKGYNGNPGLLKEFEDHKSLDAIHWMEYVQFRTRILVLMAFVAGGGGAIGAGLTRFILG